MNGLSLKKIVNMEDILNKKSSYIGADDTKIVYSNNDVNYYIKKFSNLAIDITSNKSIEKKKKQLRVIEKGIYDPRLGATINTDVELVHDYTCECGVLVGKFNEGQLCITCNTRVIKNNQNKLDVSGYIDIYPYKVISPTPFFMVESVVGTTIFDSIIKTDLELNIDGLVKVKNVNSKNPFEGIGLIEFYNRFEEIMLFFGKKNNRLDKANFLIENKKRVFMTKIPVTNILLRPISISSKRMSTSFDVIGEYYLSLVTDTDSLKQGHNRSSKINTLVDLYNIQKTIASLTTTTYTTKVIGKNKIIRNQVRGSRTSYSSRCVAGGIVGGPKFKISEVIVPYKLFLELYTLDLINMIRRGYGSDKFRQMTSNELVEFLEESKSAFIKDDDIYYLMMLLLNRHKKGLYLLINRPPTLDMLSQQTMKIGGISKEADNLMIKVPITSNKSKNLDYDGDILQIYRLFETSIVNEFIKAFSPVYHIIDRKGYGNIFNSDFGLNKDGDIGLFMMTDPVFNPL